MNYINMSKHISTIISLLLLKKKDTS